MNKSSSLVKTFGVTRFKTFIAFALITLKSGLDVQQAILIAL
jgi:hypothetical protein